MRLFFNIDSPIWRVMGFIGDLVLLNLLFILTSIPVFTIGASVTALTSVEFRVIEKRTDFVARDYFRAFKENFKNSTIIWLVFAVFLAVCVLNFNLVYNTNPSNRNMIMVILGIAMFFVTMTAMYSLAMQARFVNSLRDTVVKAFMIGLSGWPYTIVMLLLMLVSVGVSVQTVGSIIIAIPIWILIGFSGIGYLCNIMFLRVFRKVTAKEDMPKDSLAGPANREFYSDGDRKRDKKRREKKNKLDK